jgi:thioredoxin 1
MSALLSALLYFFQGKLLTIFQERHMKKFLFALMMCAVSQAALLELQTEQDFKNLVSSSQVPVVVQFAAYWCGPCQNLKGVLKRVAPSYTDDQVKIAYVDAYVNSNLGSYLQGGYPTVRVFENGQVVSASFVGSQTESYVRQFLDGVKKKTADMDDMSGAFCPVN